MMKARPTCGLRRIATRPKPSDGSPPEGQCCEHQQSNSELGHEYPIDRHHGLIPAPGTPRPRMGTYGVGWFRSLTPGLPAHRSDRPTDPMPLSEIVAFSAAPFVGQLVVEFFSVEGPVLIPPQRRSSCPGPTTASSNADSPAHALPTDLNEHPSITTAGLRKQQPLSMTINGPLCSVPYATSTGGLGPTWGSSFASKASNAPGTLYR